MLYKDDLYLCVTLTFKERAHLVGISDHLIHYQGNPEQKVPNRRYNDQLCPTVLQRLIVSPHKEIEQCRTVYAYQSHQQNGCLYIISVMLYLTIEDKQGQAVEFLIINVRVEWVSVSLRDRFLLVMWGDCLVGFEAFKTLHCKVYYNLIHNYLFF